jgi:cyclic pyranopterin phosphate synthase
MSLSSNAPVAVSVRAHPRAVEGDRVEVSQAVMPTVGPLIDRYGRVHDDLRISVTDRCNLRCVYCMPDVGMTFLPHDELLSFDEIVRVASVAASLGVTSLRLTGGEPLVRKGLV